MEDEKWGGCGCFCHRGVGLDHCMNCKSRHEVDTTAELSYRDAGFEPPLKTVKPRKVKSPKKLSLDICSNEAAGDTVEYPIMDSAARDRIYRSGGSFEKMRPVAKETPRVVPSTKFHGDLLDRMFECLDILESRHRDYGPNNIANAPGGPVNGLRVRMHDKMARINHLLDSGREPEDESIRDNVRDLVNYGIIFLMVIDDQWPKK